MRLRTAVSMIAAVAMLMSCGKDGEVQDLTFSGVGTAEVSIPLEISDIDSVVATVTGPGITTPIVANLAVIGDIATGLIAGIPAGLDRAFSVQAYVGAVLVCTGSTTVEIVAGARVTVSVLLDCSVPPPNAGEAEVVADFNFPPEIVSLTAAPATVVVNGTADLTVVATDPNGDTLTYLWTATDGTFSVTDSASTVWTAPAAAGDYSITVEVSDGTTTVSMTIVITVIVI